MRQLDNICLPESNSEANDWRNISDRIVHKQEKKITNHTKINTFFKI